MSNELSITTTADDGQARSIKVSADGFRLCDQNQLELGAASSQAATSHEAATDA